MENSKAWCVCVCVCVYVCVCVCVYVCVCVCEGGGWMGGRIQYDSYHDLTVWQCSCAFDKQLEEPSSPAVMNCFYSNRRIEKNTK